MAAGLIGLLDDVAAIAKLAASSIDDVAAAAGKATVKAAGVVVDDTAVTPQYVQGVTPDRELPIVKGIAIGSIRNKLLFILPAALLLSQFAPRLLPVILLVGGAYLAYEGAEKVWAKLRGHSEHEPVAEVGPGAEKKLVAGAVRTDLILSVEIMMVALNEVANQPFAMRVASLIVVAIAMTAAVYGFVALLVKMDDMGIALRRKGTSAFTRRLGHGMVTAMPKILAFISSVGTVAMLWVGGHLMLRSAYDLGMHNPWDLIEGPVSAVHHAVPFIGGVLAWILETAASAVVGLVIGSLVMFIVEAIERWRDSAKGHSEEVGAPADSHA